METKVKKITFKKTHITHNIFFILSVALFPHADQFI